MSSQDCEALLLCHQNKTKFRFDGQCYHKLQSDGSLFTVRVWLSSPHQCGVLHVSSLGTAWLYSCDHSSCRHPIAQKSEPSLVSPLIFAIFSNPCAKLSHFCIRYCTRKLCIYKNMSQIIGKCLFPGSSNKQDKCILVETGQIYFAGNRANIFLVSADICC